MIDLVQDVNILRPLVFMATRDFHFDALLLVSMKFAARDSLGIWRSELDQICAETGARLELFESGLDAHRHLDGQGLLFTASESHLENHSTTYDLLRHAPASYLRVTLQHGFECVGFRHSADHVRAYGETASFASDIICAWADCDQLPSLAPSQRAKVVVTGPTSLLQMPRGPIERTAGAPGIVCENLHSVRFGKATKAKDEFVETFAAFAQSMAKQKRRVTLRPHVGGQYFVKAQVPLPPNVPIENAPLYRLDLRQFSFGISTPSSILIDMLLAEIPTAVWRHRAGSMDTSSYEGLATVSSARDWVEFARAAEEKRDSILAAQRSFLGREGLVIEPREVFSRFAAIFRAAERMEVRPAGSVAERERLLFLTGDEGSTLQGDFTGPLAPLIARGEIAVRTVTEEELADGTDDLDGADRTDRIARVLDGYGPSTVLLCACDGPAYEPILAWARREQVPVIACIDEQALTAPKRQLTTRLLNQADLVYASTEPLKARLLADFPELRIVAGESEQQGSRAAIRNQLLEVIARAHEIARAGDDCAEDEERAFCQTQ